MCQLVQAYLHTAAEGNCPKTTLQEDLLQPIFSEKPVIRFGARCFHMGVEDVVKTHSEVFSCYTFYKFSARKRPTFSLIIEHLEFSAFCDVVSRWQP